jgi:hypothetical protein
MSAVEAHDYGIIDSIVGQTDKTEAADRAEAALAANGGTSNRKAS